MARAWSVCSTVGCPTLVPKAGRCEECRAEAERKRKSTAHQRAYTSKDWQRTRTAFLRAHPYCECDECLALPEVMRPRATVVDHIDGLGPLGPRGHDWSNLRAMTHAHHSRHTAVAQPGGWADRN